ncbi:MAG TPA: transporter suffix domain-containing protein [Gammaproteobacteria bacterium]|nr:transporter suffix domain-containing protein [Gammaproteobacteria bacterium]
MLARGWQVTYPKLKSQENKIGKLLGYTLFTLSCIAWVAVLLLPFSNFSVAQIVGATTILIILAELLFWCSIVLLGKTFWTRIKAFFIRR